MTHIHLNVRQWYEKFTGDTHHTVSIIVDGVHYYSSPKTYGKGDTYIATAYMWLTSNDFIDTKEDLHDWCIDQGVSLTIDSVEVSRKRELHAPYEREAVC